MEHIFIIFEALEDHDCPIWCPIWLDQTVGFRHHGDVMGKDVDDWSDYRIFLRGSIRTMTRLPAAHRKLMDLHASGTASPIPRQGDFNSPQLTSNYFPGCGFKMLWRSRPGPSFCSGESWNIEISTNCKSLIKYDQIISNSSLDVRQKTKSHWIQ